jgi:hypothetical protein
VAAQFIPDRITDLADVSETPPINNQVLTWLSSSDKWAPRSVGGFIVYSALNRDTITLEAGSPVSIHPTGIGFLGASSNPLRYAIGVLSQQTGPGSVGDVIISGLLTLVDWTAVTGSAQLAPRSTYFLDSNIGKLVTVPPTIMGFISQIIGSSLTPDTLSISLEVPILL